MEPLKDERIIKLKEQANEEFRQMNLAISSVEELIRMFHENVLAFNSSAKRYTEVLNRLLIETEPKTEEPTV